MLVKLARVGMVILESGDREALTRNTTSPTQKTAHTVERDRPRQRGTQSVTPPSNSVPYVGGHDCVLERNRDVSSVSK